MDLSFLSLPNITEDSLNSATERRKILEYLYSLSEQLRYALSNLDSSNFSDEFVEELDVTSDMAALSSRVEDAEAGVYSLRKQTAEGFTQMVKKGEIISAINQSAELIQILAQKINLQGYVTINGGFSIDEQGYMHAANGGQIGGWIITKNGLTSANGLVSLLSSAGIISGSTILGGTISGSSGFFSGVVGPDANNGWYFDGAFATLKQNGINKVSIGDGALYGRTSNFMIARSNDMQGLLSYLILGNSVISCMGQFRPEISAMFSCGSPSYLWSDIYAVNGSIVVSDANEKNSIQSLTPDLCEKFLLHLNPVSFKFNNGTSGRTHFGLVAQQVEDAMNDCGLTDMDFAGFVRSPLTDEEGTPTGEYAYGLRYSEFIAPLIALVQSQTKKITALEERIEALERTVNP